MPFTPYHFGPSGFVGLVFRKWIDVPVFLLANVVIDFEPGIVLLFGLHYPAHGLCHTFLFGTAIGLAWGVLAYPIRGVFGWLMRLFALSYQTSLAKMAFSGVVGIWFHILLDSFCWTDIHPFWPLHANPLVHLIETKTVYALCIYSFVPAIGLYVYAVLAGHRERERMRNIRTL